jgi:Family of unknown function (DUF6428)
LPKPFILIVIVNTQNMKISAFKSQLQDLDSLQFRLPNGTMVPAHFHVTEVGMVTKHFIDCGKTIHEQKTASMQLWVANDTEHRLHPKALLGVFDKSGKILKGEDLDIEVEFQTETIGKYGLEFVDDAFQLTVKHTDCLAKTQCGIEEVLPKVALKQLSVVGQGCCTVEGVCC